MVAVRDYDFMIERISKEEQHDPFCLTSRNYLEYCVLKDNHLIPTDESRLKSIGRREYKEGSNILPGGSRHSISRERTLRHLSRRLTMGLIGGFALIGPMLLMVLHNDLATTLSTASCATILFALVLAVFSELRDETLLATVAAYAAVLVVFVGSTS